MQTLGSPRLALFVRWSIVIALWALLISMATGQSGVSNYRELLRNRAELESVVDGLGVENQLLEERLEKLKTSREAQMRYLKEQFGYVEKGEIVFHFSGKRRPGVQAKPMPEGKSDSAKNEAKAPNRI
ncbi:MAG: septum formation initiator family protein [Silvanigrellales bacterium]|jgi:cell division protein FtsB|nr:septum formation initiator family protein [Silvanigrellales bacterium]